jgi:hypothetical protein
VKGKQFARPLKRQEALVVAEPAQLRRFFRIVRSDPPRLVDFTSNLIRGRPIPPGADEEIVRLWDGISVYRTESQARRHAKASPMLGEYLAELDLSNVIGIRVERTTNSKGHYTLWGAADRLLAAVVRVVQVRPVVMENER